MSRNKIILVLKKTAIAICLFLIISGSAWFCFNGLDNFHMVGKGVVYRAGQFNADKLSKYVKKYGIKSVLNLRGQNPGSDWWEEEVATCKKLGIKHYDLRLSSKRKPQPDDITELLRILKEAPKPLLIHCAQGSNRTGLVSAIYLHEFEGYSCPEARRQLSFIYGHFSFHRPAMDEAFDDFCAAIAPE